MQEFEAIIARARKEFAGEPVDFPTVVDLGLDQQAMDALAQSELGI